MATSKPSLKARIIAELQAFFNIVDANELDKMAEALANAVIDEIKLNAICQPGTFAAGGDAVTGEGDVQ